MHQVLDGMIGQEIGDRLTGNSKSRLVFLGWMDAGTRNLITKEPVAKPDDLKGMKIRVQTSPVALDTLKAMGANAVAMGTSEVFSGMQTGVIDGTENNRQRLWLTTIYLSLKTIPGVNTLLFLNCFYSLNPNGIS